jgi:hypothetical protein
MKTRIKLTAEQNQQVADVVANLRAKLHAENLEKAKAQPRISLGFSHTITQQYNFRIPRELGDPIVEISMETNSTRSYIAFALLDYALTGIKNTNVDIILKSNAAKEYRSQTKD